MVRMVMTKTKWRLFQYVSSKTYFTCLRWLDIDKISGLKEKKRKGTLTSNCVREVLGRVWAVEQNSVYNYHQAYRYAET